MNHHAYKPTVTGMLLIAVWLVGMGGCSWAGYVTSVIAGPEKIPAIYEPMNRPTLIFVDDFNNRLPLPTYGSMLAARMGNTLVDQEALTTVIPQENLAALRADHENFKNWATDRIGRQLGAEQVIYIFIDGFQMTDEDQIFRPTIAARIKVIDAASGSRLFPAGEAQGYPVNTSMFYRNMEEAGTGTQDVLARRLMEFAADKIAKLFYEHRAEEPGSGLRKYE